MNPLWRGNASSGASIISLILSYTASTSQSKTKCLKNKNEKEEEEENKKRRDKRIKKKRVNIKRFPKEPNILINQT